MSEDVRRAQEFAQRLLASADLVDKRLESPASARLVAAARTAQLALRSVIEEQTPAAVAAQPLGVGDDVEYEIAPGAWVRGKIKHQSKNSDGERVFWCAYDGGSFEATEARCRRA